MDCDVLTVMISDIGEMRAVAVIIYTGSSGSAPTALENATATFKKLLPFLK